MVDDSNLCMLHNVYNHGILLVTRPLIGENYQTSLWSMTMALATKNKADFVNGSITSMNPTKQSYN